MKKLILFFFILSTSSVHSSIKSQIVSNLISTDTLKFRFEQKISEKVETGECIIYYPKKIFCEYARSNNKILVSNGRSLVIKTRTSYYRYPLEKTPLNLILDKNFLINKVKVLDEKIVDENLINFKFVEENTEINVFFDKKTSNLIGWQTIDIYQNLSITFLYSIVKNKILEENLFKLPIQN